jgi:hypothetical protein
MPSIGQKGSEVHSWARDCDWHSQLRAFSNVCTCQLPPPGVGRRTGPRRLTLSSHSPASTEQPNGGARSFSSFEHVLVGRLPRTARAAAATQAVGVYGSSRTPPPAIDQPSLGRGCSSDQPQCDRDRDHRTSLADPYSPHAALVRPRYRNLDKRRHGTSRSGAAANPGGKLR